MLPIMNHNFGLRFVSRVFPVAYLAVDNLVRFGVLVSYSVSVRSQCLVRLISLRCITGGHIIHLPTRIVNPNCYWTDTIPKFYLQSSWITGPCLYNQLAIHTFCIFRFLSFLSDVNITYPKTHALNNILSSCREVKASGFFGLVVETHGPFWYL